MRRASHSVRRHLAVIVVAMAPLLCLALLPGHAQAAPASCGAQAVAGNSSSAAQTTAHSARIALSIDHGASGTAISVLGTAWPANAQITIDFVDTGDQNLGRPGIAQAQTDAAGAFHSPDFLAPQAICGVSPGAGTVSLVVAHTTDGAVKAQARFTFVTSPELTANLYSDSFTVQSTSIPVSGHSWGPGTLVMLYATQQQEINHAISFSRIANAPSIQVHADASGAFQATVPLPPGLPPAIDVSVAAAATSPLYGSLVRDLRMSFLLQPTVYPTVSTAPNEVAQGSLLTISGEHWRPGDTITIELCLGTPEPNKQSLLQCGPYPSVAPMKIATASVGDDGRFVASARIPRQIPSGAAAVRVYANDASLVWYDLTLPIQVLHAQAADNVSTTGTSAPLLDTPGMMALLSGALALLFCGGLCAGLFVWRHRRNPASAISSSTGGVVQSGGEDDG